MSTQPTYCSSCGTLVEADCDFCTNCGAPKPQAVQVYQQPAPMAWAPPQPQPAAYVPVQQGMPMSSGPLHARSPLSGRTESMTIQVHPSDEQAQINLMQRFHWSLLSTQEIKTIDNHLERRGDKIYQITNSQHYVKLAFSRDVGLPNLNEIRRLEQEYFSLHLPKSPSAVSCLLLVGLGTAFVLIGAATQSVPAGFIVACGIYAAFFFLAYTPKKKTADEVIANTLNRRQQILQELERYS